MSSASHACARIYCCKINKHRRCCAANTCGDDAAVLLALRERYWYNKAAVAHQSAISSAGPSTRTDMSLLALPADVQRLLLNDYLCDVDAIVARCACRALRALVPRARIDACRHRLYENFCAHGYTALLVWLYAQVPPRESHASALCAMAAQGGHLGALEWLRANGVAWDVQTCARAARGGHLAVLQWLRANNAPWDVQTCDCAARGGHLVVLQWARANDAAWNAQTCRSAARGGHLVVLQWLSANSAPWNESACARAARGGHLAVLQWLRANGVPWNEWTCAYAARGGHLTVLEWARVNGAPWDEWTCASAAGGGHLAVLQWSRLLAGERLRASAVRHGTHLRAPERPETVIWRCCSGCV